MGKREEYRLTAGGQEIAGKRFPQNEFSLGLFLVALSAVIAFIGVGGAAVRIREEKEADRSSQDQEEKP